MSTSPSFTLTKDMREKLADQLTCLAVEKHAKKIGATLKKMNATFWVAHMSRVDAILQIDRSRHNDLIQAGIVAASSNINPKNEKGHNLISFDKIYKEEDRYAATKLVLHSQAYQDAGVSDAIKLRHNSYSEFVLNFRCPLGSVPRLNGMETLEEANWIVKQAAKVRAELAEIFEAAFQFRINAVDILATCRTSKQLTDIFPEAAKLLPQPVKRTNELAPAELVNSLRDMLKSGVPVKAD